MARGRALIVDDSSTARIILARLLERADISTKGVASAEEAFTRLQNETFDIIFLDHLLPGMDGFQALEKLKSQSDTREIPVFMYTSQNAERYLQEAKARGAAGVIGKQVDREHLLKTIDAILTGTPEPEHSEALLRAVEEEPPGSMSPKTTSTRRITGRLATLEVAYEEVDEEIAHLRHA
ncbi:MAG: response regulator, partial [Pseudomonadota bacterium]|nr:response regulator [Pseudomonadota bacterium]